MRFCNPWHHFTEARPGCNPHSEASCKSSDSGPVALAKQLEPKESGPEDGPNEIEVMKWLRLLLSSANVDACVIDKQAIALRQEVPWDELCELFRMGRRRVRLDAN